jgi:hypothetical protein
MLAPTSSSSAPVSGAPPSSTGAAVLRDVVVPSPSAPLPLWPQHHTPPPASRAQVKS